MRCAYFSEAGSAESFSVQQFSHCGKAMNADSQGSVTTLPRTARGIVADFLAVRGCGCVAIVMRKPCPAMESTYLVEVPPFCSPVSSGHRAPRDVAARRQLFCSGLARRTGRFDVGYRACFSSCLSRHGRWGCSFLFSLGVLVRRVVRAASVHGLRRFQPG